MATPIVALDYKSLKEYFFNNRRSLYYDDCNNRYKDFKCHSDGEYPKEVIERQRPNEPQIVKDFRKEIWQPITKPKFTQVVSSLNKIRRSSDWAVKYPEEEFPLMAEGETLEDYCELNFPFGFTSITNWVFDALVKQYLIDPNAVILVMPLSVDVEQNEHIEPFPYIFNCCEVYDFVPEQYAVLNIPEGSSKYAGGKAFYFINTIYIQKWEQINSKTFDNTVAYEHQLGMLPIFKLGGVICKSNGYTFMYESRISGMLPNLNEAVAEYTDLQAAKRLHVYPERWEYSQYECPACRGKTVVTNPHYTAGSGLAATITCSTCNGMGYMASGPYSKMILKPVQAGQQQVPNPPAGFIEKDVEIVKIMDESWRRHIYDALAAINFQFLDKSPLAQSGVAKEVDKEELNNTVHAIAEDLVRIMDSLYLIIARYRYKMLYDNETINRMVPSIAVPDHFDLLSSQFMQDEISKAKASKLNPIIVSAMEVEYAGKRFINEPEVKDRLELILRLDPLPNVTEEEKMTMLSNKGITLVNYIISSNIQAFIQRALNEDADFALLELDKQIAILQGYAQEQIDKQEEEQQKKIDSMELSNQNPEGQFGNMGDIPQEEEELVL